MSALRFTSVFSLISTLYIVALIVFKGIQQEIKFGPVVVPDFDWSMKLFVSLPIMAIGLFLLFPFLLFFCLFFIYFLIN